MSVKLMGSLAGILVMRLEARLQLCKLTLFISRNTASGTQVAGAPLLGGVHPLNHS